MMIATVVAVALGVAPEQDSRAARIVTGDYSAEVGHFSNFMDGRGTTHVKGRDRNGRPYELIIDRHGYVEARVGEQLVQFRVREAN